MTKINQQTDLNRIVVEDWRTLFFKKHGTLRDNFQKGKKVPSDPKNPKNDKNRPKK